MKKLSLKCLLTMLAYGGYSQSILIHSDTIVVKKTSQEMTYNLIYSVSNAAKDGVTANVSVTDLGKGSAQPGVDYFRLSMQKKHIYGMELQQYYPIQLLETKKCDNKDKTILLHLKGIPSSGDTTYYKDFTLTIKHKDTFTTEEKDSCKGLAKAKGQTWRLRYPLPDPTNTAKIEFVTYTDLKGFDPDAPNGLVQNQFLLKWPIIKEWTNFRERKMKTQVLRSFVFPNILLNRIDKSKDVLLYKPRIDSIDTNGDGRKDSIFLKEKTINSFDVIKYSNIVLNGKVTLLNLQFPKSRLMLEYDMSVYRLRVDTTKLQTQFDPVYALSHGPHVFYEIGDAGQPESFQLRFILGYENLRLRSNIFHQVDGYSTNVTTDTATISKLGNTYADVMRSSKIWQMSARLSRSISKDNKANIFFRFNISWQQIPHFPGSNNLIKSYNQYSQYQLGANLNLGAFGG